MIKANELRVGNLVAGAMGKVYVVNANMIKICSCSSDWVDAIPLSREIIKKCGFDYCYPNDVVNFYKNGVQVWFNTSEEKFYLGELTQIEIKSFHQLQNLYFALTNEELTIEDLQLNGASQEKLNR